MTVHFAIPATTFVLRALIEARLKVAYGGFTPPKVSVEPPPRPPASPAAAAPAEPAGLVLFMYQAGQNPAWRNMYDPHVAASGIRTGPAPLVLDLHYLLAATGADLEREVLLGVGMSALHRNGIIPRPMIQALLSAVVVPALPTFMDNLTTEPLHLPSSQPEQVTVSPMPVDLDLSTKLWSALQSPMRPCTHYLVTTVFLDPGGVDPPVVPTAKVNLRVRATPDKGADPSADDVAVIDKALP